MAENFANNYSTALDGAINNSQTTFDVLSVSGAPAVNFRIKVENELMLVTGVSSLTFTVTRGIEGTTAASHADGTLVTHVLTAGAIAQRFNELVVPWSLVPVSGLSHSGNNTLGATNNAVFRPVIVPATLTLTGIGYTCGASSGNLSVGVYDETFNRLATSGAVAAPGTGRRNVSFTSPVVLTPGRYWIAISQDNNTMTYSTFTTVTYPGASRVQNSAHPLPSTASPGGEGATQTNIIGLVQGGWPS